MLGVLHTWIKTQYEFLFYSFIWYSAKYILSHVSVQYFCTIVQCMCLAFVYSRQKHSFYVSLSLLLHFLDRPLVPLSADDVHLFPVLTSAMVVDSFALRLVRGDVCRVHGLSNLGNKPRQESHLAFEEVFNSVALVTLQDIPQIIQML